MSSLIFLSLYHPVLSISIILVLWNLTFVYAQPDSLQAPKTSKVIPYNSSTSPLSGSFTIVPESSKSIPYNSSTLRLPLSSTPSFSVTNASLTFSNQILNGNTSKQVKNSIVSHTIAIINGEKH
jgi:hypothetical protein